MNGSLLVRNEAGFDPPAAIISDWIEIGYLMVLFMVGAPLNTTAFARLNEHPGVSSRRNIRRLETLKRHVNYSDLLIIFLYIPSRICWTLTYQWRGGPLLCKLVKFGHALAFQSNSNVIVCVSLDRVFSILSPSVIHSKRAECRVRVMLCIAWLVACAISVPQLIVYTVFEIGEDWEQCTTTWNIDRYVSIRNTMRESYQLHVRTDGAARFNLSTASTLFAVKDTEFAYVILHQVCVFLLPALIIASCYTYVALWLFSLNDTVETMSAQKSATNTMPTSLPFLKLTSESGRFGHMRKRFSDAALSLLLWKKRRSSQRELSRNTSQSIMSSTRDRLNRIHMFFRPQPLYNDDDEFVTCGSADESVGPSVYFTTAPDEHRVALSGRLNKNVSTSEPSLSCINDDSVDSQEDDNRALVQFYDRRPSDTLHLILNESTTDYRPPTVKTRASIKRDSLLMRRFYEKRNSGFLTHTNVCRIKRNSIRVSGLLVFAYIVCWLPYNVLTACSLVYPHLKHEYKRSFYFLKDFIALNAVLNPFLYGMFGTLKRCTRINA